LALTTTTFGVAHNPVTFWQELGIPDGLVDNALTLGTDKPTTMMLTVALSETVGALNAVAPAAMLDAYTVSEGL
jgi:hypothetical protein